MQRERELEEKIIVLRNYQKVKDKKMKLMEDRIDRQNKIITLNKERIAVANNYIDQVIMYKAPKELWEYLERLQDIINGNNWSEYERRT